MDNVLIDLGFFQIKWYSIFILTAVIVAYFIINKETKKKGLKEEDLLNIIFYGIIIGILGARIYYVLFNLDYYLKFPQEIIMIWNGGLAIHGGLLSTLLFLFIYSRKRKINLLLLLDTIVVGVIIAQAIGRWGNFFNQEAYGRIISGNALEKLHIPKFIINGMKISGKYREPTFLYESVSSVIGFIVLLFVRKIKSIKTGTLTSVYLIWYGITRLIIESFRSDSLMLGPIKVAQLISVIGIISGIIIFIYSVKKNMLYKNDNIYIKQNK